MFVNFIFLNANCELCTRATFEDLVSFQLKGHDNAVKLSQLSGRYQYPAEDNTVSHALINTLWLQMHSKSHVVIDLISLRSSSFSGLSKIAKSGCAKSSITLSDKNWGGMKDISEFYQNFGLLKKIKHMRSTDEELTRRQCLITAAASSCASSFLAMSSTCCRLWGWGSRRPSLTPAGESLRVVKCWAGRPGSFSERWKIILMLWQTNWYLP